MNPDIEKDIEDTVREFTNQEVQEYHDWALEGQWKKGLAWAENEIHKRKLSGTWTEPTNTKN